MGQAKRRGTYEERKAAAIIRKKEQQEQDKLDALDRAEARAKRPRSLAGAQIAAMFAMAEAASINYR